MIQSSFACAIATLLILSQSSNILPHVSSFSPPSPATSTGIGSTAARVFLPSDSNSKRGQLLIPKSSSSFWSCALFLSKKSHYPPQKSKQPEPEGKLTDEEFEESMQYLATLIERRLQELKKPTTAETTNSKEGDNHIDDDDDDDEEQDVPYQLAKGRFIDLSTTLRGELILEILFKTTHLQTSIDNSTPSPPTDIRLIQHAITSLQSLLIYAMQIGVKGSEEQQKKLVRHLFRTGDKPEEPVGTWIRTWDGDAIRRLKFHRNVKLGKEVLAKLIRKRTAQGAMDLVVEMGVWGRHEDTALLRSGFPIRFLEEEERASMESENITRDPDSILGIRKDLRHQKVYTIDGDSTLDIDDGISVEVLKNNNNDDNDVEDSQTRYRYWIHIADVDRWAPRGSSLLKVAERRGTSLYLPTSTLCMFPPNMSSGVMSLESYSDKYALSLGVELNPDGSIIPSSIVMTPSLVQVDYRLTYDQVDEMLDEGVGYTEEWQIGAMLAAATKRRAHRVGQGSTEGMVPYPIPKGMVSAEYNEEKRDYDVSLRIETTHNSGANMTAEEDGNDPYASPVSSSQLIVTEMMILAGEAIGKWQKLQPIQEDATSLDGCIQMPNPLKLPFRRQPAPDFKSRAAETRQLDFLLAMNKRYPHAWYARRFFNKVSVSEDPGPHFGMGLECYVQWTSPIRRLTDLQVHAALKRYLRRKRVNALLLNGLPIPSEITNLDLGYDISELRKQITAKSVSNDEDESPATNGESDKENNNLNINSIDRIDYTSGLGMIYSARPIQWASSNYWNFEYIRQLVEKSETEVMFECIVLGCINKERFQYAVYVYELGLEHRYVSESGKLDEGRRLWLKVASVNPRLELLTFSLASRSGGNHAQPLTAPAA